MKINIEAPSENRRVFPRPFNRGIDDQSLSLKIAFLVQSRRRADAEDIEHEREQDTADPFAR
jgi:hypothetical protein